MPADRSVSPWLEVRAGRRHGVLEISVLGELDLANHHELRQLLDAVDLSGSAEADLDLAELTFSDARGACHLLDFVQRGQDAGCEVRVIGAQHAVARVLGVLTRMPDTA